jgi:hypothetical protein
MQTREPRRSGLPRLLLEALRSEQEEENEAAGPAITGRGNARVCAEDYDNDNARGGGGSGAQGRAVWCARNQDIT